MQEVFNKAYKGLMEAIEGFANSSAIHSTIPKKTEVSKSIALPDYAYPCNNYIDAILDNKFTRQALRAIATKHYGKQVDNIIKTGTELTPKNYPHLFANFRICCQILNVINPPKVFVTTKLSGINALSVEIEKDPIIMLSYVSIITLSDKEQRFLLGHELGHIQYGHMLAHTVQGLLEDINNKSEILGPIVADLIDIPLNRWYRTSEFTADRAGYLCCKNMDIIKQLFKRFEHDVPINAFTRYKELSDAYPLVTTRIKKLLQYSMN